MSSAELEHRSVTLGNGVRVTRLPVGRVNGRLWLSFVIDGQDLSESFSFKRHIRLSLPSGEVTSLSGGGGGSEVQWFEYRTLDHDADLTITYLDDGVIVSEEVIPRSDASR